MRANGVDVTFYSDRAVIEELWPAAGEGVPTSDTTPPTIAITSPANNSTTIATQTTVSGTAFDGGQGASGVAHVYVNDSEAAYNTGDGTWTISNVALALGANQITARAVDQAGNQVTTSITVTHESPTNHAPTVGAGPDQRLLRSWVVAV